MKTKIALGLLLLASVPLFSQPSPPESLTYQGAFRLPRTASNGRDFSFGGSPLAYNPTSNTLFVGTRTHQIAEVSIPTPATVASIDDLPVAEYVQGFADPTEGGLDTLTRNTERDWTLGGLYVDGDRLLGSVFIGYDAQNVARVSHFARSTNLSRPSLEYWSSVWEPEKSGFVAGYMAAVPRGWQARLGGDLLLGQCCLNIITRTSYGPSAFAVMASQIGLLFRVPAIPIVYYTGEHPTLGRWEGSTATYGATAQVNGLVLAGDSALFIGSNGTGPFCYGHGTSVEALDGTLAPDGVRYCYDPANSDKGQHAYPYRAQIWAYALEGFADVKAGRAQPWELAPSVWPLEHLQFPHRKARLGGVGFDAAKRIIYLSQLEADQDGYQYRALIHAFAIAMAPPAPPTTDNPRLAAFEARLAALEARLTTLLAALAALGR